MVTDVLVCTRVRALCSCVPVRIRVFPAFTLIELPLSTHEAVEREAPHFVCCLHFVLITSSRVSHWSFLVSPRVLLRIAILAISHCPVWGLQVSLPSSTRYIVIADQILLVFSVFPPLYIGRSLRIAQKCGHEIRVDPSIWTKWLAYGK